MTSPSSAPAPRRVLLAEDEALIRLDLKEMLPQDSSAAGFDNVGEALHASSFLMERYLEAADMALNAAIASGPQPPMIRKRYDCKDERQNTASANGKGK